MESLPIAIVEEICQQMDLLSLIRLGQTSKDNHQRLKPILEKRSSEIVDKIITIADTQLFINTPALLTYHTMILKSTNKCRKFTLQRNFWTFFLEESYYCSNFAIPKVSSPVPAVINIRDNEEVMRKILFGLLIRGYLTGDYSIK